MVDFSPVFVLGSTWINIVDQTLIMEWELAQLVDVYKDFHLFSVSSSFAKIFQSGKPGSVFNNFLKLLSKIVEESKCIRKVVDCA